MAYVSVEHGHPHSRERVVGPARGQSNRDAAPGIKLRRSTVLKFWCPVCGAPPSTPCAVEGTGEVRAKLHRGRVEKAEELISAKLRALGRFPPPAPASRPHAAGERV